MDRGFLAGLATGVVAIGLVGMGGAILTPPPPPLALAPSPVAPQLAPQPPESLDLPDPEEQPAPPPGSEADVQDTPLDDGPDAPLDASGADAMRPADEAEAVIPQAESPRQTAQRVTLPQIDLPARGTSADQGVPQNGTRSAAAPAHTAEPTEQAEPLPDTDTSVATLPGGIVPPQRDGRISRPSAPSDLATLPDADRSLPSRPQSEAGDPDPSGADRPSLARRPVPAAPARDPEPRDTWPYEDEWPDDSEIADFQPFSDPIEDEPATNPDAAMDGDGVGDTAPADTGSASQTTTPSAEGIIGSQISTERFGLPQIDDESGDATDAETAEEPDTAAPEDPEQAQPEDAGPVGVPIAPEPRRIAAPTRSQSDTAATRMPQVTAQEVDASERPQDGDAQDGDAQDGAGPDTALARNATEFSHDASRPLMAFILLDEGLPAEDRAALAAADFPFTIALDPRSPDASDAARDYATAGKDVLILAAGLPSGASASDIDVTFDTYFSTAPSAIGLIDLAEGQISRNAQLAREVAGYVARDGYGMVSFAGGLNNLAQQAEGLGLAHAQIFRVVDPGEDNIHALRRVLDRAVFEASQIGHVIIFGDAAQDSVLSAIALWHDEGRAGDVTLAPVSAILLGD